jgi:hypothetical protein
MTIKSFGKMVFQKDESTCVKKKKVLLELWNSGIQELFLLKLKEFYTEN